MEDPIVAHCKNRVTSAMEHFLRSLRHVPADKIDWRPSMTSKSTLQIAAHAAGFSGGFARLIREGKFPPVEEFLGPIQAKVESIETVEQAEVALREGTAETLAALEAVKPEWIGARVETPIGITPFAFFMNVPADHLIGHAYQIDFLQTCWGDQEVYFES